MKISFENPDKVNGLMTITVEEADYKDEVEKTLKDYRKRANVPGFRPGQVPMGLVKRQYGMQVKVDVINRILGENLQKYITDNKIQMLGQPMAPESQESVDLEKEAPYEFKFDIAVAPEFKIELNGKNKIDYYEIAVDDKLIDQQVEMFQSRAGHYDKVDTFDPEQRDMLKGDLRELDENGNTLEGGITVEGASLMPQYIKVEDQKKLFDGAKLGDIITFNPTAAYPDNDIEVSSLLKIKKDEVAGHKSNFSYQITEISRFVKAENNAELWKGVYGEQAGIKVEDNDVRESARQMARAQFAQYGMTNVPDDYLNGYADEMLKKRENIDSFVEAALDRKLAAAVKEIVKLNVKSVSLEEFNKLVSGQ